MLPCMLGYVLEAINISWYGTGSVDRNLSMSRDGVLPGYEYVYDVWWERATHSHKPSIYSKPKAGPGWSEPDPKVFKISKTKQDLQQQKSIGFFGQKRRVRLTR